MGNATKYDVDAVARFALKYHSRGGRRVRPIVVALLYTTVEAAPPPKQMHSLKFGNTELHSTQEQQIGRHLRWAACSAADPARAAIIGVVRTIEAVATTSGSRDAVWALLADATTWAQWGAWSRVEVEGGGQQGPDAVRLLVKAPFRLRERITEWVPGERMGYELLDGMRVRGYKAQVTLEEPDSGGTVIRWRSMYERAGPLTALVLHLAVRDACRRLAKAASA